MIDFKFVSLYTYCDVDMKKNKILVAKIIIGFLLFFIVSIGLLKFIDYLEAPTDNFLSALNSVSDNFGKIKELFDNDLYKIIDSKFEANIDTKISTSNFIDTNYAKYSDLLETSSFITALKYDSNENYLKSTLKVTNNDSTYSIDYLENGLEKYIKDNGNTFEQIGINAFNLKKLNKNVYFKIAEIIINEIEIFADGREIINLEKVVDIDNNSYDTEIKGLMLSGNDTDDLIKTIIKSFVNDKDIYQYMVDILGVKGESIDDILKGILKTYEIKKDNKYVIFVYIDKNNKQALKFTFGEYALKPIFSYECIKDYHSLTIIDDNYKIIGTNDNFTFIVSNSNKSVTLTYKKAGQTLTGSLNVNKDERELYHLNYSCEKQTANNDEILLSLLLDFYPTNVKDGMKVALNSSILIKKDVNITKSSVLTSTMGNKQSIKDYIDDYLSKFYNYFRGNVDENGTQ